MIATQHRQTIIPDPCNGVECTGGSRSGFIASTTGNILGCGGISGLLGKVKDGDGIGNRNQKKV